MDQIDSRTDNPPESEQLDMNIAIRRYTKSSQAIQLEVNRSKLSLPHNYLTSLLENRPLMTREQ